MSNGTGTATIRIVLVDDHDRLRNAMSLIFSEFSDIEVIGQASSGAEAIAMCSELRPDVVLMDVLMFGVDGLTATRMIREKNPDIQVVVLSSFGDEKFIRAAKTVGVNSYLLKNVSVEELADAIRSAHKRLPGKFPETV